MKMLSTVFHYMIHTHIFYKTLELNNSASVMLGFINMVYLAKETRLQVGWSGV